VLDIRPFTQLAKKLAKFLFKLDINERKGCENDTYSTEYSFCPIGWQMMKSIALHNEWKSLHSSTVITPFWGTDVCHTSS
jgi:hypothetical protein